MGICPLPRSTEQAPRDRTPPAVSVDAPPPGAAEALQAVFALHFESEEKIDQRHAIALCSEICTELGVDKVDDLAECDEKILETLPPYVKTQLTPQWRENFVKMCECRAPPADLSRS